MLVNAAAYGAKIGNTLSSVQLWFQAKIKRYGHVALVEAVEGDNFMVSEMNYKGRGIIDQRWISIELFLYKRIHLLGFRGYPFS